jgi:hypothetical protein
MHSTPGIQFSLYVENVGLVFTTKLSFSKKSMLISNQKNHIKVKRCNPYHIPCVVLVGLESQHEHI